jgi:hypothetical protein
LKIGEGRLRSLFFHRDAIAERGQSV